MITLNLSFGLVSLVPLFFISLVYWEENKQVGLINDGWLKDRMEQVGILTWKQLREKTGFTPLSLKLIRKGEIFRLELGQFNRLANALNWQLEELLDKLDILKSSSISDGDIWRLECERLSAQIKQQSQELTSEAQEDIFNQLQTLLTNYPSLRQAVQAKPELPARNVIALFTPLDNLVNSMGYTPIGKAWQEVEYSPQLHQPDSDDIQPGERVYIRFVGYQKGEKIITPAKVSRSLPGGIR